jgi:hypothetical protein
VVEEMANFTPKYERHWACYFGKNTFDPSTTNILAPQEEWPQRQEIGIQSFKHWAGIL